MRGIGAVLLAAGCGRVGFDAPPPDARAIPIQRVATFAQVDAAGLTTSFTTAAQAAGDAIVLFTGCRTKASATATVTAPGWTFVQLGGIVTSANFAGAVFVAFAPDGAQVTVDASWTTSACADLVVLADELAGVDPAGGMATFDAVRAGGGTACSVSIPTGHDRDAIWAACYGTSNVTAPGAGYSKGADNTGGDWTEYRITTDPAGTVEDVSFTKPVAESLYAAVALAPSP